ncbi:rhodanese-like domain-containing protein [bacterium]|nr:rhodanese-like domain-containing protein [bacterium]
MRILLAANEVALFDVNAPARWAKAHVPAAINLDPEHFTAADLPATIRRKLVFYCANSMCRKAPIAARRANVWDTPTFA